MLRTCAAISLSGTLLLGQSACGQILTPPPPPPPIQPPAVTPHDLSPPGRGIDRANVSITKQADGQRRQLRYSPKMGSVENFNISIRTQNAMAMGPAAPAFPPSAEITMLCRLTVEDVAASGEITCVVGFVQGSVAADPDLPPKDLEDLTKAAKGLSGTSLRVRIDALGAPLTSDWAQPPAPFAAAAMDAFRQVAARLAMVLPEDEVTLPATWKTVASQRMNTIDAVTTSTLQVSPGDAGEISVALELTRSAPPHDMATPNAPHATQSLRSLIGAGVSESVRRLDRISPLRMTLTTETDVTLAVGMKARKGQPEVNETFTQKFRQTVRIDQSEHTPS